MLISGFHNLMLYDARAAATQRILSLREADIGSGVSCSYRWTPDSEALLIYGLISGTRRLERHGREISLAAGGRIGIEASGRRPQRRPPRP